MSPSPRAPNLGMVIAGIDRARQIVAEAQAVAEAQPPGWPMIVDSLLRRAELSVGAARGTVAAETGIPLPPDEAAGRRLAAAIHHLSEAIDGGRRRG